jgi:hypothetical protein
MWATSEAPVAWRGMNEYSKLEHQHSWCFAAALPYMEQSKADETVETVSLSACDLLRKGRIRMKLLADREDAHRDGCISNSFLRCDLSGAFRLALCELSWHRDNIAARH